MQKTKKIIVASTNPVKVAACKSAFEQIFPDDNFEFSAQKTNSGVSDQPMGDDETTKGAYNRVQNAYEVDSSADFYVGIEGGLRFVKSIDTNTNEDLLEEFSITVIGYNGHKSKNQLHYSKASTGTFILPEKLARLIKEGKELGEATDQVFSEQNSKQKQGAVGLLTGGLVDRKKYLQQSIIFALIPFKNESLYK
jgi:inosine/xanthosine triphosphatase